MRQTVVVSAICIAVLALTSCGKKEEAVAPLASAEAPALQVPASELHLCRVTGTRLTDEDCAEAQYWLDQTKKGTAAVSAPTWMLQGQTKLVTLAVGTAPPPEPSTEAASPAEPSTEATPLAEPPTEAARPPEPPIESTTKSPTTQRVDQDQTPHQVAASATGTTNTQVVDYYPFVGKQMSADLEGDGFDIRRISQQRVQPLSDGAVTTWEWEVKARDYGKKKLIIKTAVVMINSQGKPEPLKPTTEFREVSVVIGFGGFYQLLLSLPDWLKIIAAIIVGSTGVIVAWKSLKKASRNQ